MPLIFTPKVLRYANLYFFIQNLSEWHFSNRKDHNETWRNELHFSAEAESCLDEFKKIHQQYSFGDKYLGRPFFLHRDPWPAVELLVGKDECIEIKNIFAVLEPYFDTIYIKDEVVLKKWKRVIAKPEFVTNASYINNALANFYGCAPYNKNCTIYLLLSTEKKNGGTAGAINNDSVTLELSRTPIKSEKHVSNVLWHELIHLYFKNCVFYPLLEKCTNNDRGMMGKIDELVASSLLPNGLLKQNALAFTDKLRAAGYFNARINSEKKIINIQKLIHPYLQQKKMVDINLAQKLYKIELESK